MSKERIRSGIPYAGIPILAIALFILHVGKIDAFILLQYELLLLFGYIAAMSDLKSKRIPNGLILAMLAAWVLTMVPKIFFDTESAVWMLREAMLGFLVGGGLFLLVYIVSRQGLGGGDVKFMAAAGLYLGFADVLSTMLYGAVFSAITALVLMAFKKIGRKDAIPLAPFLYAGVLITIFVK